MKSVTIKDVAKAAGVSTATVSLVLAGKGNISEETRKRIQVLVKEMNYIPDWSGRNLKGGKSNVIALYVSSIRGYYSQLADAICTEIHKSGYELDIIVADRRESIMAGLLGKRNDGAILLHHAITDDDAELLLRSEIPVVFLDRRMQGRRASCVLLDSYRTGWEGARYLFEMGHRQIMFVKGSDSFDADRRFRGFLDYCNQAGYEPDERYFLRGNFDRVTAYNCMKEFLNSGLKLPHAIFACNDASAFGCVKALHEKGIRVPEQVSVMGCDGVELGRWFIPSLTTISTDIDGQGIAAARELLGLIRGEASREITIPGQLVERDSCMRRSVSLE